MPSKNTGAVNHWIHSSTHSPKHSWVQQLMLAEGDGLQGDADEVMPFRPVNMHTVQRQQPHSHDYPVGNDLT